MSIATSYSVILILIKVQIVSKETVQLIWLLIKFSAQLFVKALYLNYAK